MAFHRVFQGEDRVLEFYLEKDDGSGDREPLASPTEITMSFLNDDDTLLTKTLTGAAIVITSDDRGEFEVTLTAAETALLKKVKRADLCATFTRAGGIRKYAFEDALTVESC